VTKAKSKPKSRKGRKRNRSAAGGHDVKSRRKYDRGSRVEAYTFGEALGKKGWP